MFKTQFKLKPPLGIQLNKGHPLARGLVGCWLMNEGSGSKVFDLSGNRNTGNLVADTHFVPGKFGSCLDFDGNGDFLEMNYFIDPSTTDFTVAIWFKADTFSKDGSFRRQLISQQDGGGTGRTWIDLESTGELMSYLGGSQLETGYNCSTGKWTQVALVHGNTANRLDWYVDSEHVKTHTSVSIESATGNYIIAIHKNETNGDFDGQIDNVMIFNRALGAVEIALLYRKPFCMFATIDLRNFFVRFIEYQNPIALGCNF